MIADKLARGLVVGAAIGIAACGGEGLTLPPEGEPAHITLMHGDGQSGRPGETLGDSVVVRVTDTRDRPVEGASVNFSFAGSAAAAVPPTATTNADGVAWSKVTLGNQVGEVGGVAEVPVDAGITPVRAEFTATILPGDANGIVMVSGDGQSGPVNSELPAPLVVKVTDQTGNPISGIQITWTIGGGGSVSLPTTVTGADGQTSVTRTLGPAAGQQTAQASSAVPLAGSPVTFTHTATAGTAAGVNKISGDNQSALAGTQLAQPLVVQVLDAQQNPIVNAAVTWIVTGGGGSLSSENTNTDSQGLASVTWTLGPAAGANTLNAVVSGVGSATFNATGTAGTPSADNSLVSASPTSITAGTGTSTVTVTVRDASNNPVSGVSVSIASSGSGNSISPPVATGGNGLATFTFSSTVAEAKTITATAGGVAITDQATITVNKASSTTLITSDPEAVTVGQTITVEFAVTGNGGTPTGNVTVTVSGGPETCNAVLDNGSGSCPITFAVPGSGTNNNRRVVTATYGGDAQFSGSSDTDNQRVDPLPNQPPVAQNDGPFQVDEDGVLTVDAPGLLANDSDPEGGPLTIQDAGDPQNGTLQLTGGGGFTYTPNPDFFGTDQFTYFPEDAQGASSSATVTITVNPVNDPPTASFTVPTNCAVGIECGPFDATSSSDIDGTIVTYQWDFQDGTQVFGQTVNHTFATAEPHTVNLTVTDNQGATGSASDVVNVAP